jgi:hypothetical protein
MDKNSIKIEIEFSSMLNEIRERLANSSLVLSNNLADTSSNKKAKINFLAMARDFFDEIESNLTELNLIVTIGCFLIKKN